MTSRQAAMASGIGSSAGTLGAIPALGLLRGETLVFVAAVIAGIVLARAVKARLPAPAAA